MEVSRIDSDGQLLLYTESSSNRWHWMAHGLMGVLVIIFLCAWMITRHHGGNATAAVTFENDIQLEASVERTVEVWTRERSSTPYITLLSTFFFVPL